MDMQALLQIKVNITDKAALDRLPPANVMRYLLAKGWTETAHYGALLEFTPPAFGAQWIILLPSLEFKPGDYSLRMSGIFARIAAYECRSQLAIYVEMLEAAQ